jgi:hypothetical protein
MGLFERIVGHGRPELAAQDCDRGRLGAAVLAPDGEIAAQRGSIVFGLPNGSEVEEDRAAFALADIGLEILGQDMARAMLRNL